MNKKNLKKLGKSELINMLLKQDKKNTEIIIVDVTKPKRRSPIPKPRKSVKQMAREYEEKKVTKPNKIFNYPMIDATLDKYRKEDLKISNDLRRNKKIIL